MNKINNKNEPENIQIDFKSLLKHKKDNITGKKITNVKKINYNTSINSSNINS